MYTTFHIRNNVRDHWFDPREGLWCVFTVKNVPLRTFLTYTDVSVCKLSHIRTCLFATCHLISHVLSRLPCFHTNVSPMRRVLAHVRTLQDECLHTFWLTKTCLCVTFNIWHHLFHLTTHICSRNDVPPLDFNLRTFLRIQLWHMKQCLRTLVLLIRRTVFTVKRRAYAPLFDLHSHVRVQILTHEPMSVCSFEHNFPLLRRIRRVSTSCINCETWQCAIFH